MHYQAHLFIIFFVFFIIGGGFIFYFKYFYSKEFKSRTGDNPVIKKNKLENEVSSGGRQWAMKEQNKNSANRNLLEDGKILRQCDIFGGRLNKQKSDTKLSDGESIKCELKSQTASGFPCNIVAFIWLECNQWLLCKLYINEFTCVFCCWKDLLPFAEKELLL